MLPGQIWAAQAHGVLRPSPCFRSASGSAPTGESQACYLNGTHGFLPKDAISILRAAALTFANMPFICQRSSQPGGASQVLDTAMHMPAHVYCACSGH